MIEARIGKKRNAPLPACSTIGRNRSRIHASGENNVSDENRTSSDTSTSLPNYLSWSDGSIKFPTARRSGRLHSEITSLKFLSTSKTTDSSSVWLGFASDTQKMIKSFGSKLKQKSKFISTSSHPESESFLSIIQDPNSSSSNARTLRSHYEKYSITFQRYSEDDSSATSASRNNSNNPKDNKSRKLPNSENFFTTPVARSAIQLPRSSSLRTSSSAMQTGTESSNQSVILAIIEGRGKSRGEVGLAAMDLERPHLIICQISDSQTYVNTLRKINVFNPSEIIIPNVLHENMSANNLYKILSEEFPVIRFTAVQRKYFDDSAGLQRIQNLCLDEYSSVLPIINGKVYALAAAASLLQYGEYQQNTIFSSKSLRINFQSGEKVMYVDLKTVENLELVSSKDVENASPLSTLFGVLNNCCTIGGQRRLRSVLLQPSTDECEIEGRLQCVQELMKREDLLQNMKMILPKFWDVEQLLSLCGQITNSKDSDVAAELQINYIILLKTSLEVLPALKENLASTNSNFFISLKESLLDKNFDVMLRKVHEILNEDAHLIQKYDVDVFQRCFAIKTGINSFLDIARIAYTELVQDFNDIVNKLIQKYNLPLEVKILRSKGPVLRLRISKRNCKLNNLPKEFIQIQTTKHMITMTTKDLLFLKERMNHFVQEIQLLSSSIICEVLMDIREYIGTLYKFCENIAELDLVVAFAHVSKHLGFTCPQFTPDRMDVRSSVHPILNQISSFRPIANDIVASIHDNVCIITGPNMGGKSIYIRQVALLQIMAQIGCFVPADCAQFRLADCIFSRIGFNDNIQCNASTFIVEIKEMHYILQNVTPHSIVIIDELCRGTSTEEGTALAWAITEELLASSAFVFFATHFFYLTKLQDLYCNVSNYHLEGIEVNPESDTSLPYVMYTHRLLPGVSKLENYGLKLARSTAIPEKILQFAQDFVKKLSSTWKACSTASEDITMEKKIDSLIVKLLEILDNGAMNAIVINEIIEHVKEMIFVHPPNLTARNRNNKDGKNVLSPLQLENEITYRFDEPPVPTFENSLAGSQGRWMSDDGINGEIGIVEEDDVTSTPSNSWNILDKEDAYFSDCISSNVEHQLVVENVRKQNRRNCFSE